MCVCVSECAYTKHAQKPEGDVRYPILSLSLFPWDKVSPWVWNLVTAAKILLSLPPTVLGYNPLRSHAHLLVQVLGFKLSPHIFTASTITQKSPCPSFISLYCWEWKQNDVGTELTKPERSAQKNRGRKEESWACSESSVLLCPFKLETLTESSRLLSIAYVKLTRKSDKLFV